MAECRSRQLKQGDYSHEISTQFQVDSVCSKNSILHQSSELVESVKIRLTSVIRSGPIPRLIAAFDRKQPLPRGLKELFHATCGADDVEQKIGPYHQYYLALVVG